MKKPLVSIVVSVVLISLGAQAFAAVAAASAAEPNSGLIPPPVIYTPSGGSVIGEINFSDKDVLALIQQAIPEIGALISNAAMLKADSEKGKAISAGTKQIDWNELATAIGGIKNIRLLAIRYPAQRSGDELMGLFEKGLVKTGTFSRVMDAPGGVAIYAEPGNAGYAAVAYDQSKHILYAARVVGFLDLPKLVKWLNQVAEVMVGASKPQTGKP